jgi:alpha-ribazole phosphatase
MEIFLIRHTTPAIAKGICYGQTDIDVTSTFTQEANIIKQYLPTTTLQVYSSPLVRCKKLAQYLFEPSTITLQDHLMELNCGKWEMQPWDNIALEEINPWMSNFVHQRIPQGESYTDLHTRVVTCFNTIVANEQPAAVVAHGGVLRSILSYLTNTDLQHSFNVFKLHYGCVVKLSKTADRWKYEMLSNITPVEKEQHKPSSFKTN